jgi:universal bacterial protein YeaZ
MIYFLLDSYGKTASVAIYKENNILFENVENSGYTHSETLLPLCIEAFESTGINSSQIDVFGVTNGPGSFTGLRIGLATIKGLALPNNTPVVPVSTLEALAHTVKENGIVVTALDARRNEIYYAIFEKKEGSITRISEDCAAPVTILKPFMESCTKPVFFVGDGAVLCYNIYGNLPNVLPVDESPVNVAVGAFSIVSKAFSMGQTISHAELRPVYLRLSQAERERLASAEK